ncbi:MAG: UDP-N-acetylmuramoyl-L-alanyl-D-glutamate--2,6-diaminopimelate ligase [Oscillospiraceae bacterium]|nr:UDP-N-acetylmuramoyl-L-alanyl-D-glutamate--2,6-diaminopimelate ligase [Oscillospiraceae bacterium]
MLLTELLEELDVLETNADPRWEISGIHNDCRSVRPGGLFVAVAGASRDGHEYVRRAIENGARAVVVERPAGEGVPYIAVRDTREALHRLGSAFSGHPARRLVMAGITGTNGKTTVTHLLYGLLKAAGHIPGLVGTNHVLYLDRELPAGRTTPDAPALHSLFKEMADAGCTHCVMEVSSHALEQRRVAGVEYEAAVFTNLTRDHLDYHKDMEAYYKAKAMLFGQCRHGIVNADDEYGRRLNREHGRRLTTYGIDRAARVRASEIECGAAGVRFTVQADGARDTVAWGTPGRFTVYNALAAISAALALGMSLPEIAGAMPGIPPVRGRMEVVPVPAGFTVLIDYAHTPDALENVLRTAREYTRERVIAVFGCGGDRDRTKRPLMGGIAARLADIAVVTSDNPRTEEPERIIDDILAGMEGAKPHAVTDRRKAIRAALSLARPGDTVLICGKGHETAQEVRGISYPMDEREIIRTHFHGGEPVG